MKQTIKLLAVMAIAAIFIFAVIIVEFKTAYQLKIGDKQIGFVINKEEFEDKIRKLLSDKTNQEVAYVKLEDVSYKKVLIEKDEINEEEILNDVSQNATAVYRLYAISENSEAKYCVNTLEEAEKTVEKIKEEYAKEAEELDLAIQEVYTDDLSTKDDIEAAIAKIESDCKQKIAQKEEAERRKNQTVNGVYLAVVPVNGNITSRFGSRESIRNHAHKGLDIAARNGTKIKAAADGTVTCASYTGGYGNLVIIDHGNGIKTYYGHCSRLYVSVGDNVSAGDIIAAVGSTGNSTGNHLHFEIRLNDEQVNPQTYLYR